MPVLNIAHSPLCMFVADNHFLLLSLSRIHLCAYIGSCLCIVRLHLYDYFCCVPFSRCRRYCANQKSFVHEHVHTAAGAPFIFLVGIAQHKIKWIGSTMTATTSISILKKAIWQGAVHSGKTLCTTHIQCKHEIFMRSFPTSSTHFFVKPPQMTSGVVLISLLCTHDVQVWEHPTYDELGTFAKKKTGKYINQKFSFFLSSDK